MRGPGQSPGALEYRSGAAGGSEQRWRPCRGAAAQGAYTPSRLRPPVYVAARVAELVAVRERELMAGPVQTTTDAHQGQRAAEAARAGLEAEAAQAARQLAAAQQAATDAQQAQRAAEAARAGLKAEAAESARQLTAAQQAATDAQQAQRAAEAARAGLEAEAAQAARQLAAAQQAATDAQQAQRAAEAARAWLAGRAAEAHPHNANIYKSHPTALHTASERGDTTTVEALLRAGSNVNGRDSAVRGATSTEGWRDAAGDNAKPFHVTRIRAPTTHTTMGASGDGHPAAATASGGAANEVDPIMQARLLEGSIVKRGTGQAARQLGVAQQAATDAEQGQRVAEAARTWLAKRAAEAPPHEAIIYKAARVPTACTCLAAASSSRY
ncbi:hypothetical protein TSOC_013141 [Tetrabaena socialis]|uniref:Uncharacterized protein n=1 Tax=Tetrabaena socialis TaxID=47790 RepID=A0A2J7ZL56_9CHLO|nr:hypothetical protein TSOC_013141 [Tetrabaena socialis]|eukprot:PNH00996.1 hypothetical protein TSOC_013141 [Tetrabaena socialis]